jgi:hypothetical protein
MIQKKSTEKFKIKQRVVWGFNPISRVKPSKKLYSRKKYKISNEFY